MESVNKAKNRLKKYPLLILDCQQQGALYAKCVINNGDIKKNDCLKEFEEFKNCLLKAATKRKTRL